MSERIHTNRWSLAMLLLCACAGDSTRDCASDDTCIAPGAVGPVTADDGRYAASAIGDSDAEVQPLALVAKAPVRASASGFTITSDTCTGIRLAPHAACAIRMAFRAKSPAPKTATLAIVANPGHPERGVPIGRPLMPETLTVNPHNFNFGDAAQAETRSDATFTVRNTSAIATGPVSVNLETGYDAALSAPATKRSVAVLTGGRALESIESLDATEALYRAQIIRQLYGSRSLPVAPAPDLVETDHVPSYPYNIYNVVSPNLLRIDRITYHVDGDIVVYAYHYVNTSGSKSLAISHEGHSYFNLPNQEAHIEALLNRGWNVVLVQMPQVFASFSPPAQPNPTGIEGHDSWAYARELKDPGYMRTFLAPALYVKQYLKEEYHYDTFAAIGLSGGGWTVNWLAALDPEIRASFSVAGSGAWDVFFDSYMTAGDYEQFARGGAPSARQDPTVSRPAFDYLPLDYRDLYAMGATGKRFVRQVYIDKEAPGYFVSEGLHSDIDTYINACDQRVSGTVSVAYDATVTVHEISDYTTGVIISDLDALGLIGAGPTGEDENPPTVPNMIAWYRGEGMSAGQMTDRSPNANDAIQPVAANQAKLIAEDPFIKQPCLEFDGTEPEFYRRDNVLAGGAPAPSFEEYTLIGVLKKAKADGPYVIFLGTDPSGTMRTGPVLFSYGNFGGTMAFDCTDPTKGVTAVDTSGEWQWVAAVHTPTERKIYINGVLRGTTPADDGPGAVSTIGIGGPLDGTYWPFGGRVAELMLVGRALSTEELAGVGGYIHRRYGL